MSASPVVRFGLIPALVSLPLTAVRAWLETAHPESLATKLLSVFVLGLAWFFVSAALILRQRGSFKTFLKTAAVFCALFRAGIAVPYALAWTQSWTTPEGAPARYVVQIRDMTKGEMPADASFLRVFLFFWVAPAIVHVAMACVAWLIVRFGFFRRPAASAS
jgi:hypothetical protein